MISLLQLLFVAIKTALNIRDFNMRMDPRLTTTALATNTSTKHRRAKDSTHVMDERGGYNQENSDHRLRLRLLAVVATSLALFLRSSRP